MTAYEDLPDATKKRIQGLVGIHIYGNRDDPDPKSRTSAYGPDERRKQARGITYIRHPLVRKHPLTGRKVLYAVSGTSVGIDGMPDDRSCRSAARARAAFDADQVTVQREPTTCVTWWRGTTPRVLHSATLVDPDDARTLWRITVKERERPAA